MKNFLGLIKYILIILVVSFMPLMIFWSLSFYEITHIEDILLDTPVKLFVGHAIVILHLALIFFLALCYIVMPTIVTLKALKNHWSIYLDFFLNNVFLLTIVLILLIKGFALVENDFNIVHIFNFETHAYNIFIPCLFILPIFILIYITAIFYKIINLK